MKKLVCERPSWINAEGNRPKRNEIGIPIMLQFGYHLTPELPNNQCKENNMVLKGSCYLKGKPVKTGTWTTTLKTWV